jgi:hypothetical protein
MGQGYQPIERPFAGDPPSGGSGLPGLGPSAFQRQIIGEPFPPTNNQERYLAAILEELRGIRWDIATALAATALAVAPAAPRPPRNRKTSQTAHIHPELRDDPR